MTSALALTTLGTLRWNGSRARIDFRERDWVLIAAFENRTGDPALDGVLEHALGRELSNSRCICLPGPSSDIGPHTALKGG